MKIYLPFIGRGSSVLWVLLFFLLQSCATSLQPVKIKTQDYQIGVSSGIEEDTTIVFMLAPFKAQLKEEIESVIGDSKLMLTKTQPEGLLGNWMTDAIHKQVESKCNRKIDFVFCNYGGLRTDAIPAGSVTQGKIFELMPFDNRVVILSMKGSTVRQLFDRMATSGGWPISYPVRYQIRAGKAVGITINGKPLEEGKTYQIGSTDFIANGNGGCAFLKSQPREGLPIFFRETLIEFIAEETKAGRKLFAKIEGRVTEVD